MRGDGASPLGRYTPEHDETPELHTVQLLGVPLRVLLAGREHHDGVMREFRLLALAGTPDREVPVRMLELTEVLGRQYAAARARPDRKVDEALDRGEATLDLDYEVPADIAGAAARLEALMSEADEFCADEQLMALERTPTVRRFAQWYLAQFASQIAGDPPTPWDGPLDP